MCDISASVQITLFHVPQNRTYVQFIRKMFFNTLTLVYLDEVFSSLLCLSDQTYLLLSLGESASNFKELRKEFCWSVKSPSPNFIVFVVLLLRLGSDFLSSVVVTVLFVCLFDGAHSCTDDAASLAGLLSKKRFYSQRAFFFFLTRFKKKNTSAVIK